MSIGNYEVLFPYDPYTQQEEFIVNLIDGIENSKHCLLESPTGTGKTLSLLSGSLAWIKANNDEKKNMNSKLFYASRTHAQISQLVSELKSTPYRPTISILASRDHLCINSELVGLNGTQKINKCQQLRKTEGCSYYSNLTKRRKTLTENFANKVLDVEELFAEGVKHQFCPYYLSKIQVKEAHVVFLPYTFLTNEDFFFTLEKEIQGGIVVFDEAHNVSDSAEEGNSLKFTKSTVQSILDDLTKVQQLYEREGANLSGNNQIFKMTQIITLPLQELM